MELMLALAGNPNSGKTTFFNELTGSRQHVGNYPGVTVEKKEGVYQHNGQKIAIVDLPGTYSLTAYSEEEVVARNFLVNKRPDTVINIVDASNLERNLYLTVQFLELGIPVCIALNMIDVAKDRGLIIDDEKLSSLLGIPIVPTIARSGKGKKEVIIAAVKIAKEGKRHESLQISYGDDLDKTLLEFEKKIQANNFMTDIYPARWIALKYLENDNQILDKGRLEDSSLSLSLEEDTKKITEHLSKTLDTYPEAMIADYRYGFIKSILKQGVIERKYDHNRLYASDQIDKVLTHRLLGPFIMLMILMGLYHITFTYGAIPMGWLESFFGLLGDTVSRLLPDGLLRSMIVSGVIDGVGGVLGFVPLIMLMFFGIAILEDSGYLSRVAYMLDRVFKIFGLHGNSVMPFIVSGGIAGGCAVPGIMATRTLKSRKERLATMLTAPFMNCGAKLPVMALLIGTFFSENSAFLMFMLTLVSWAGALIAAKILRMTIITGSETPFVLELPPYRWPTLKGLLIHTWERSWQYIKKAGTVILGISIIIWAMMTFPQMPTSKIDEFKQKRELAYSSFPAPVIKELKSKTEKGTALSKKAQELRIQILKINNTESEEKLKNSVAGKIGTSLESITRFTGFDWRTNIALIGGFAAKEVVISTLGTAYSLGEVDPEDSVSLGETLAKSPHWNPVVALSLIIFTMFYAPCFVAVVVIIKESGSWKWGAFSIIFNTAIAFVLSTIIFQGGLLFNLTGG